MNDHPPPEVPPNSLEFTADPPDQPEKIGQTLAEVAPTELSESDDAGHFPWPRFRLPLILFLATLVSTFYRGFRHWIPWESLGIGVDGALVEPALYDPIYFSGIQIRRDLLMNLDDGLIYMAGIVGILLAHELGHFFATRIYRVPATWPLFIPMPFSPIGTMGAVILMDNRKADRKMMFDIGLAGPLAGLVVAAPLMAIGMMQLDLDVPPQGTELDMPVIVQAALPYFQPKYEAGAYIAMNQISPLFMAGWVGFLITGLNMLPVGQLDGGHVTYALFGKGAHMIARIFMGGVFAVMAFSFYQDFYGGGSTPYYQWLPMAILVYWIGIEHPPTADDSVPLGTGRMILGILSLAIPPLTFAPALFVMR